MVVSLKMPLSVEDVLSLRAGDEVELNGFMYTARDAAHARMVQLIQEGKDLPFDITGQIIYYSGPAPTPPGRVMASAGPTTSCRMDKYTPQLLERGLRGTIGKGKRSDMVKQSFITSKAVYFIAVGGAGALLGTRVTKAEIVAYPELGPEAVYRLEVRNFPVIVCYDTRGGDIYKEGIKACRREDKI